MHSHTWLRVVVVVVVIGFYAHAVDIPESVALRAPPDLDFELPPCGLSAVRNDEQRRAAYLQFLDAWCNQHTDNGLTGQYLISRDPPAVFAVNPKVMSTSTKLLLAKFKGINITTATNSSMFDFLSNQQDAAELLRNSPRIMFVRNPITRMYSAWAEKFVHMQQACDEQRCTPGGTHWYRLAKTTLAHYNITKPPTPVGTLAAITWPVFLRAVLDRVIMDRHWSPQVVEVGACSFRPTFVGALEHSNDDIAALLRHLGKDPADFPLARGNPTKRSKSYDGLYPSELLPAVAVHYKPDFRAFGYSPTLACANS